MDLNNTKNKAMLKGKIENIIYHKRINSNLIEVDIAININAWPTRCIVRNGKVLYSVSKWVSPKRTRSYPFSRVYDTFSFNGGKRITIIPIVKDEGITGDRDYLQWATIALMSLLNVYVIISYYEDGEIRGKKITNQKFPDDFIKEQILKLESYHSSALHWNLDQLNPYNLRELLNKVILCYRNINKTKNIKFHEEKGLFNFYNKLGKTVDEFKKFSSLKAIAGQHRESLTKHILEVLGEGDKMKIIIENYLGGLYYFTIDDVLILNDVYYLRECKNTTTNKIPSEDDIKDGLLKLILYANINTLLSDSDEKVKFKPVLILTSTNLVGSITQSTNKSDFDSFIEKNGLQRKKDFLKALIDESIENNIELIVYRN